MADKKKSGGDGQRAVTKAEFVGLMTLLAQKDRERYRELRAQGWAGAIPLESEYPN